MLRTLFGSPRQQSKDRRPKETAKPRLEVLEDRTVPSATLVETQPFAVTASPQPARVALDITSNVIVMIDQSVERIAAFEHNLVSIVNTVSQVISQEVASFEWRVDGVLGINPNPSNTSLNTAVMQSNSASGVGRGNSSGSGSGGGALTTGHNTPNQTLTNTTKQGGRGTGNGSSATTNHVMVSKSGVTVALTPGSGGSGSAGSGIGSIGSGIGSEGGGIVSGNVWLDNNGDGSWDNSELGYQGITVELFETSSGTQWTLVGTTTTGQYGNYSFSVPLGPTPEPFVVHVELGGFNATFPTSDNQINNYGNSAQFLMREGGWRHILAGLLSMTVTTTQDDTDGPIQNQITLRDAIQTGNNGGGPLHLSTIGFNPRGTIALNGELDAIKKSFNIVGPGSDNLTVDGQLYSGTIFTVNAGVTSTISGLTIKDGSPQNGNGGGVLNNGNLTLNSRATALPPL